MLNKIEFSLKARRPSTRCLSLAQPLHNGEHKKHTIILDDKPPQITGPFYSLSQTSSQFDSE